MPLPTPADSHTRLYDPVEEVDAPAVLVDLDTTETNLRRYADFAEEHGWVDTSECEVSFEVGDRIEWIPPHVCTTANLHDTLVGTREDRVEAVWNVQARGKVR